VRVGQRRVVANREDREVVVVAEREERHRHRFMARGDRHAEHAVVELFCACLVAYFDDGVPDGLYRHGCLLKAPWSATAQKHS